MSAHSVRGASVGISIVLSMFVATVAVAQSVGTPGGPETIVGQIEQAVKSGDGEAYLRLLAPDADGDAARAQTASLFEPGATRVVLKEQDRACAGLRCRVIVDVFREYGAQARLSTWRIDLLRQADAGAWTIAGQQVLSSVTGLYRLALDPSKAFQARGVTVEAEDFGLRMADGTVFVVEAAGHPTTFVFVGKGEMTFAPSPATERGQARIFCGSEQVQSQVDAAFVRVNPNEVADHIKGIGERQVDLRDLKRGEEVFRENNGRSFSLDLPDLTPDVWTLVPREGDFITEAYTKRYGGLTYGVAPGEAEDLVLFDRKARRNIAQYASRARLAARGRFYDESERADYQVTAYDLDVRFAPGREWMEGVARLSLIVRAPSLSSLTLRLDDGLSVRSVTSPELGRLLPLRVHGRNTVIVTLPAFVTRDTRLALAVTYAGTVHSQRLDREATGVVADQSAQDDGEVRPRAALAPSYIYTNRPFWYPQSPFNDYATANLRVGVPAPFSVVASGERLAQPGRETSDPPLDAAGNRTYAFAATQPVRYLSLVVTPLVAVQSGRVRLGEAAAPFEPRASGAYYSSIEVHVQTNPVEKALGRELYDRVADIVRFYSGLLGDCPYPTLNVALVEQELPGGHSPGYMAAINFVSPRDAVTWRGDPAYISGFPEYFIAHEIAHQWWGQAVGWKNYHEQWLSEAFAQYFSALYAEHRYGRDKFLDVVRQWQRWATDRSDEGPVYLGYRVGHIKGDGRAFRAVVYNKGALVLEMLRRLMGDDTFFRGLRRFYFDWRFRKAGTDDFCRSMEAEAGVSLERFFDGWIFDEALPRVRALAKTEAAAGGDELVVQFEQEGRLFDVPMTVSIDYADRPAAEVRVRLAQARQELRIPLAGSLRKMDLNRSTVAIFSNLQVINAPAVPPAAAARTPRPR